MDKNSYLGKIHTHAQKSSLKVIIYMYFKLKGQTFIFSNVMSLTSVKNENVVLAADITVLCVKNVSLL